MITITIKTGKTLKIKVGKDAKITKISNKKIVTAKIKENIAVIKGKKAGTATITIKRNNNIYKITLKVK